MKKTICILLTAIMVLGLFPMLAATEAHATGEKLEVTGGTYLYDGKAHAVVAKVTDGVGFTIEYSTDGGKTWTAAVPSLTDPGKITVNVRAIKDSTLLTHTPVSLEVTKTAPAGSTITIIEHNGTKKAPIRQDADSNSTKIGEIAAGKTCTLVESGEKWYKIKYGTIEGYIYYWFVKITSIPGGGGGPSDPDKAKLTVTGGVFLYDGKAHAVVATLTDGEGFTVEYSTNGGKNWTTSAPSLTDPGKLTVKVRAIGPDRVLTHDDVILQILSAPPAGTKITIVAHNGTTTAPIRQSASSNAAKIGSIKAGKTCTYLDKSGSWYKIKYGDIEGYVYYWFVEIGEFDLKPVITEQPAAVKVVQGKNAMFTVTATDAETYKWEYQKPGETTWNDVQKDGTYPTYLLKTKMKHNGYVYRCKVGNEYGFVYSKTAKLTVTAYDVVTITAHPAAATVALNASATFGVAVVGDGTITFKWQYQKPGETTWNDVQTGGSNSTYVLAVVKEKHNGYVYRCKVDNEGGTVYSNTAKLTVVTPPVITTQPTAVKVVEGKKASFTAIATGTGLTRQWQYKKPGGSTWNDVKVNGTGATYTLTTAAKHNGYTYRLKVKNAAGTVYSNAVVLTVVIKPKITTQPTAATVSAGNSATFTVVATGDGLTYKWQYQKPGETSWNDVLTGGNSATYTLATAKAKHNGYIYRCKIQGTAGTIYSNAAKLTVN